MDTFKLPPFSAALPGAFAFVEERPSAEKLFQHASTFQEAPSGHRGIREMTRQQWEALKPLLRRIYIDENRPFPYLAKILREEYGFETTRQFSRKIDEWSFRKNVSRSERRSILEALPRTINEPAPDPQDWRLKPGKLKNWRRRYRGEVSKRPLLLSRQSDNQEVQHNTPEDFPCAEPQTRQNPQSGDVLFAFLMHEASKESTNSLEPTAGDAVPMDMCLDTRSIDWSLVNISGSPGLSRLFKGLKIECSASIPPLSLDTSESDEPPCMSNLEIQELLHNGHTIAIDDLNQSRLSEDSKYFVSVDTATNQHPHYPWRDIDAVFCGHTISPLTEIYVFPPGRNVVCKAFNTELNAWESLKVQETELEVKFAKLKEQFKIDHPAVMATMEKLSDVYYKLHKDREASIIDRRLLDLYYRTLGPMNIRTMTACKNLVYSLVRQGRYLEAQSLNSRLLQAVLKVVKPYDPLAIMVTGNNALIAWEMEQVEKSESLRRELLQIQLTSYGPRDSNTIQTMVYLGYTLAGQSKKDGETLLRTAVQLALGDPGGVDEKWCEAMRDLIDVTYTHSALEERCSIASKATDMFMLKPGRSWYPSRRT